MEFHAPLPLDQSLRDPVLYFSALRHWQTRMPQAYNALNDAFRRVERADQHLADLSAEIASWREAQLGMLGVEAAEGGRVAMLMNYGFQGPPPEWSVVIGELIYNLRAALDYLVYGLAWVGSGVEQSRTQFLIEDDEASFRGRAAQGLCGVLPQQVEGIRALQPFRGCTWTREIRDLSNQDKHRALHLVVAQGSGWAEFQYPEAESDPDHQVRVKNTPTLEVALQNDSLVPDALAEYCKEVRATLEDFKPAFEPRIAVPLTDAVALRIAYPSPPGGR